MALSRHYNYHQVNRQRTTVRNNGIHTTTTPRRRIPLLAVVVVIMMMFCASCGMVVVAEETTTVAAAAETTKHDNDDENNSNHNNGVVVDNCQDNDATTETNKNGECKNPAVTDDSQVDTTNTKKDDNNNTATAVAANATNTSIRMITKEELALHKGDVVVNANNNNTQEGVKEEGETASIDASNSTSSSSASTIWLSILGEVYDVTHGGKDYYGPGAGYSAFAGLDCSLCFVSGTFTQEEGDKETSEIPSAQIPGLMDWRNFYADHATYKFVGYLLDDRYYNEDGKPTEKMLEFRERVIVAMEAAAVRKLEREKKRAEVKQKRLEEKKKKEAEEAASTANTAKQ